jgi:hypothetical protein
MLKVLGRDSRAILPLTGRVPSTQQANQTRGQSTPVSMKAGKKATK